jgi:casein kinase II subunit beta
LTDRFNLTGLNTEIPYYQHALDLITDVFDLDCEDDMRETIEKSARHLYGLVHARYIVTTRGLAKMVDKYKKNDFGRCPRVFCEGQALLPMGQSDLPALKSVKLYCARCEDCYNPKSSKHAAIDGAYFGTSFHNMLFQVYPALVPTKSRRRFEPRIFGFKVHAAAALARWQDEYRREQRLRLMEAGIGMVDAPVPDPAIATAGSGSTTDAAEGSANTLPAKIQKLYVEDDESDDGMAEVVEEARLERERVAAAGVVKKEENDEKTGLSNTAVAGGNA